jgi:ribosomal protein L37AE/L43A
MVNSERKGTQSKKVNECAQCGNVLIAPVWSEHLSERSVRHLWDCDGCGYKYETTVFLAPRANAKAMIDAAA